MNIVIVSIEEPVYFYRFWKHILAELHEQVSNIYIFESSLRSPARAIYEAFYKFILALYLYRIKDIVNVAGDCLGAVFYKKGKLSCSLSSLAEQYNIPSQVIRSVNSREFRDKLLKSSPDFVLAQIPVLVGKESLSIPKLGWVNKHFGMLPDYKGEFPFLWAWWNREDSLGVTIHFMNERYDEGDIIGQRKESVRAKDTLPLVFDRLNETAAELMVECIKTAPRGQAQVNKKSFCFKKPALRRILTQLISEKVCGKGYSKCG